MSMRACERCLENGWDYVFIDGFVTATRKFCGAEVQWEPKQRTVTGRYDKAKYIRQAVPGPACIPGQLPEDREGKLPWQE